MAPRGPVARPRGAPRGVLRRLPRPRARCSPNCMRRTFPELPASAPADRLAETAEAAQLVAAVVPRLAARGPSDCCSAWERLRRTGRSWRPGGFHISQLLIDEKETSASSTSTELVGRRRQATSPATASRSCADPTTCTRPRRRWMPCARRTAAARPESRGICRHCYCDARRLPFTRFREGWQDDVETPTGRRGGGAEPVMPTPTPMHPGTRRSRRCSSFWIPRRSLPYSRARWAPKPSSATSRSTTSATNPGSTFACTTRRTFRALRVTRSRSLAPQETCWPCRSGPNTCIGPGRPQRAHLRPSHSPTTPLSGSFCTGFPSSWTRIALAEPPAVVRNRLIEAGALSAEPTSSRCSIPAAAEGGLRLVWLRREALPGRGRVHGRRRQARCVPSHGRNRTARRASQSCRNGC